MKRSNPNTAIMLLTGSIILFALFGFKFYQPEIPSINIGDQTWMSANLTTDTFSNGDRIEQAKSPDDWSRCGDQKRACWCYYDFDAKHNVLFGKLYNWYAVNDSRGLAPKGWKIASEQDWEKLFAYVGGTSLAGVKLKHKTDWQTDGKSTNTYQFSALPGGFINGFGTCLEAGIYGYWWTSTEDNELLAISVDLYDAEDRAYVSRSMKKEGLSVRCLLE